MRSTQPAAKQKYSRRENVDKRGGGMVLECQYVLLLGSGVIRNSVITEIQLLINQMEGNETVY